VLSASVSPLTLAMFCPASFSDFAAPTSSPHLFLSRSPAARIAAVALASITTSADRKQDATERITTSAQAQTLVFVGTDRS
jgi:hypothetical protein